MVRKWIIYRVRVLRHDPYLETLDVLCEIYLKMQLFVNVSV